MSWAELSSLGVTVRPLTDPRPPEGGRYSPFKATLTSTIKMLVTELRALDASVIVLELDLRERDIRVDGLPRADARPSHDGVALSFDSKFGPQRYATAEYAQSWSMPAWQANLRAIALSLQALRSVDRYGVSRRGEQYVGWRELPRSTDPADAIQTEDAWGVICEIAGIPLDSSPLQNGISKQRAIALALKAAHPDTGGDADTLRKVVRAKELLGI